MELWKQFGFSENPYSPRPIPADESGVRLLVGREKELKKLLAYIRNSHTHPTLEGPNGVGKTSLVSVAGYILRNEFIESMHSQAILPVPEPFQLSADDTPATFKRRVFLKIAQAFIDYHDLLADRGYKVPDVENVNLWLNSPTFGGVGGGISIAGFGVTASGSTTANTSSGFSEAGFVATVSQWLRECFPTISSGGFLCNIDNLELLVTSKAARNLLEALRDELLILPGLRWVLCGARGIVRAAASSPRMQGILAEPTNVAPIGHEYIRALISARLDVYSGGGEAIAPVEAEGFDLIYRIGNNNLRNAMKYSEDFTLWAMDAELEKMSSSEKLHLLQLWMKEMAETYMTDTSGVGKTAWSVFDKIAQRGEGISPSEHEEFGFKTTQAMRPHLRDLEEANLIESALDETDDRRKTIHITSRGWIVNYCRSEYKDISGAIVQAESTKQVQEQLPLHGPLA